MNAFTIVEIFGTQTLKRITKKCEGMKSRDALRNRGDRKSMVSKTSSLRKAPEDFQSLIWRKTGPVHKRSAGLETLLKIPGQNVANRRSPAFRYVQEQPDGTRRSQVVTVGGQSRLSRRLPQPIDQVSTMFGNCCTIDSVKQDLCL